MEIQKKLEKLCSQHQIELIEKPNGHFQLKGLLMVNYYPFSKNQSAYVAGTKKKICHVTPDEAIKMCSSQPKKALVKDGRSSNSSRKRRQALLNKGLDKCCWCDCKLDINNSTLEHIIPLSRGGLDNANNWNLACEPCNTRRGDSMMELSSPQKT